MDNHEQWRNERGLRGKESAANPGRLKQNEINNPKPFHLLLQSNEVFLRQGDEC